MNEGRDLSGGRILVIGGAGFVGSHVVDLLTAEPVEEIVVFDNFVRGSRANLEDSLRSPKVRIAEGDIRDPAALAEAVQGMDHVFHLAALWLLQCKEDPRAGFDVNTIGTFNVIESCRKAGVRRIVYSSSASVYGDMLQCPMREDHPFNNRTMYGATKIAGEQMFRAFHDMYGLEWVGLRYFNIYGPRQDYRGAYVSVIMKALDRIDAGLSPIIFGDGSQSYDFIYIKDVARSNIAALKATVSDECFNIASGTRTSINELVGILLELTGSKLKPEYRPTTDHFVSHRLAAVERAQHSLGFQAATDLREGLRQLIEWRRAHMARSAQA